MPRRTYSDDRATGEWATSLRGSRRVTVVARAEDSSGYEWVAALKGDYLPAGAEAKSALVLPILDARPEAWTLVSRAISSYAIVLVDVNEFGRQMAQDLVERVRFVVPPGEDPFEFVSNLRVGDSNASLFLRQATLSQSVLGRLEAVMEWSANPFAEELERAGFAEYGGRPEINLVDRERLLEMDDRQLANFLARFGAAVGDALSPQRQAEVIQRAIDEQRYFSPGYYATNLLRMDIETDKTYDVGSGLVLARLLEADGAIWNYVEKRSRWALLERFRRGTLHEEKSHLELGLQAADIAAALASRAYEHAEDISSEGRLVAVKRLFARVMFNGRWV
jgi:hypothetical protein